MTLPKIISVDDHVVEPAHLFKTWLPQAWRDRAPYVERRSVLGISLAGGTTYNQSFGEGGTPADCWIYEDLVYIHKQTVAAAGMDLSEISLDGITYDEMRPGCYDPAERVKDMVANWVDGSLCFPTFPRFAGQTFAEAKDKELAHECVLAYNNFMVDEWCGDSGGVLIPLAIIQLWDVDLAVQEIRRNAARGVRAVAFSEIPYHLGLPSIYTGYWDPFFRVCEETGTVICMHIGSSSKMPATSPDAPPAVSATLVFNNSMASLTDFIFSATLAKFPDLKVAYSEGQIGWLPYALERADDVWMQYRGWGGISDLLVEPPSYYYRRSVFGCFFRDQHGVDSLDIVGADNVTFETDYPHTDSTWPNTKAVAEKMLERLSDEDRYKILRGNALRMLGMTEEDHRSS
jgi:predicted TIM-barrel fold metal-dependent hydrolase